MFERVSKYDFSSAFHRAGRGDQFSHAALDALFDYLEEMESDLGEEIELDVIGLCTEWSEYSSALEAAEGAGYEKDEDEDQDEDEIEEAALDWLRDQAGTVIEVGDGSVVIQNF